MCIKCELLNIICKESKLKTEKSLLSKDNYLTTDLLNESRKIMQESKERYLVSS